MNSFKTIDGRGVNVAIAGGACITIQYVTNIIIHGINIHDCRRTGNAMVRSSPSHYGWRTMADGDAISIFGSSHIWIDHNSLSNCADGLIDAIMGSTAITISNNYLTHHNEVRFIAHYIALHNEFGFGGLAFGSHKIFAKLSLTKTWFGLIMGSSVFNNFTKMNRFF